MTNAVERQSTGRARGEAREPEPSTPPEAKDERPVEWGPAMPVTWRTAYLSVRGLA